MMLAVQLLVLRCRMALFRAVYNALLIDLVGRAGIRLAKDEE